MINLLAALFLGLVVSPAFAVTFYVDGDCGNNGDGSIPTCDASGSDPGAWNSIPNINCAGVGVTGGDIIQIAETSLPYRLTVGYSPPAACGGSAGNPVIFQNSGDVVIEGTVDSSGGSDWTSIGGGIYECTAGVCQVSAKFPFTAWYNRGAGEERLDVIQSKSGTNYSCTTSDGPATGEMRIDMRCTGDGTTACRTGADCAGPGGFCRGFGLCVQLSDSSDPNSASSFVIPSVAVAIALQNFGTDYVTFRVNPSGGSFTVHRFKDHVFVMNQNNLDITIDGLDVGWAMDRCINDSGVSAVATTRTFINNTVHHCGQEGIDVSTATGVNSLVEGNTVSEIQTTPFFELCLVGGVSECLQGLSDNGVAIMIRNSADVIVRGNTIHDVGGGFGSRGYAINLEIAVGSGAARFSSTLVEDNLIYDLTWGSVSNLNCGHGIILSTPESDPSYTYDGTIIRNNRVHNVDNCFTINMAFSSTATQTILWQNNTCVDPVRYGFFDEKGTIGSNFTFTMENMLWANLTQALTVRYISLPWTGNPGISRPTNSLFYCPTPHCSAGATIIDWTGPNFFTNDQTSITDFQASDFYGNPVLDMAASPPTMKIVNVTSVADQNGTCVVGTDFEGDIRPQGVDCDIGADELVVAGTSTTTSSTTTSSTSSSTSSTSLPGATTSSTTSSSSTSSTSSTTSSTSSTTSSTIATPGSFFTGTAMLGVTAN